MGSTVFCNKEPMVLINNMDSYFKEKPPDCSLFSDNNFEFPIHKELFFQTKVMCEMIENVNYLESCCSKIEILCPSLAQKDLEMIVKFLYTGKIICANQESASEVTKNLTNVSFCEFLSSAVLNEYSSQFQYNNLKLFLYTLVFHM